MPRKLYVHFSGTAEVTIADERVVLRITENRDDKDRPEGSPGHDPQGAYRAFFYDISTEEDVLKMLVWNAAANGVERANQLDGWADLDRDAAVTAIEGIDIDHYADVTG
jgi:hypothetical protein